MSRPKGKITNCPHTDRKHNAMGRCRSCYVVFLKNKYIKKRHGRAVNVKKMIRMFKGGATYYKMSKVLHTNVSNVREHLIKLGLYERREFNCRKEIKKMSKVGDCPNRVITISKNFFIDLGIDYNQELLYRLHTNKDTGRIEIEVIQNGQSSKDGK